ncbi:MAG: nucleotide sugar dehydrogenase [Candidatus Omnitrophica bacterium]|jgi:UDP-N-acetyl-D-glucosamine dehydrogenase|nr:nucleotide sugar dehydrogenase [Candidatus Omnitrophota bacterium]
MDTYALLKNKIQNKKANIGIIGLGYVGLPLAIAFSKKGYLVYGVDTNSKHIERLNKGERYIVDIDPQEALSLIRKKRFVPTIDASVLGICDCIIICVPTPLRRVKMPDVSYVLAAAKTIKKYLQNQLIILESTSYPATTREVVLPVLRGTGQRLEKDFFLCFSSERVNPADKKFPLTKIPKVVGGFSEKSTELACILYSRIINKVFPVSSPEVAETAKLLENTFRLVNIALANEFALVCNKLGISVWEVIEAAKTKPFGFMPFYPGPGLGGHCIPIDPLYLSWKAKKLGFKTKMIDLASYINHFMPKYVIERLEKLLGSRDVRLKGAKILILGVAYKKDVKDLRESPAIEIIETLQSKGANVSFHDPFLPYLKIDGIDLKRIEFSKKNLKTFDCVIVVTDHSNIDYNFIKNNARLIFDTRNVYKRGGENIIRL